MVKKYYYQCYEKQTFWMTSQMLCTSQFILKDKNAYFKEKLHIETKSSKKGKGKTPSN